MLMTDDEIKCWEAVYANRESVEAIKNYLCNDTGEGIQLAKEALGEISHEDQNAMWRAPTKCRTAPFTTKERAQLKGIS